MRMVLVDKSTGRVVNTINANSWDRVPDEYWMIEEPVDLTAGIGRYVYAPETGFVPDAAYQAELDAEEASVEQEGLNFA